MPDKISKKVINIFDRHKQEQQLDDDEKVVRCSDGICYVCVKKDENGHHFDENHLVERANAIQYIVRIMIKQSLKPYIYNYKVPGEKLIEFLSEYINGKKEGQIIEVEKYYPNDLA